MALHRSMAIHRAGKRRRRLLVTLAASLLLLMQAMVLEHQLDLEHHHEGGSCELCLHFSPLDQGLLPSSHIPLQPVPADTAVGVTFVQAPRQLSSVYHPRAPPRLS
jgi:hypothetical protein